MKISMLKLSLPHGNLHFSFSFSLSNVRHMIGLNKHQFFFYKCPVHSLRNVVQSP